jgi:DNA polymerase-1
MATLLLDGHNLLYRAFTSLPRSILGNNGLPINGVYGFLGSLLRLSRELSPDRVVTAFDVPDVPTFRHQLFPGYQAQRGPLGGEFAEDFARQALIMRTILPSINVPVLTAPTFEADDILGTLSASVAARGGRATVVSTDRDLLQLVRPGIEIVTPANPPAVFSNPDTVQARMGVRPEGIPTFKALAGDASDNIPGVARIGTRTAASLVNELGSLEEIFDALGTLPARVSAALVAQRDQAFLFRRIVTVVTDLDLPLDVDAIPPIHFDPNERARGILDDLGY